MNRINKYLLLFLGAVSIFTSCIGDDIIADFVEPTIRFTTVPDTIKLNSTYQFEFVYLNNVGVQEDVQVEWTSSDPAIIEIGNTGLASALSLGNADISVEYKNDEVEVKETINVQVGTTTVEQNLEKSGTIQSTSTYALKGSFTLKENNGSLLLQFADDYEASSALPGLFVYFSNNRNSIANAYEIAAVEIFNGSHSYTIPDIGINDYEFLLYYCKPFNVKVGDGEIK